MIALLNDVAILEITRSNTRPEDWGICMEGRFKGWLMRRNPHGGWISHQRLKIADSYEGSPFAAILGGPIADPPVTPTKPHHFIKVGSSIEPDRPCPICGHTWGHPIHAVTEVSHDKG